MAKNLNELKQSLTDGNIEHASAILTGFYKDWDRLDEETQAGIREVEPAYLTMICTYCE